MVAIGVIGDFNPRAETHLGTNEALQHAAHALATSAIVSWVSTVELTQGVVSDRLASFDALWGAPGSPYVSMEGALRGIRFAREKGWPFFGT